MTFDFRQITGPEDSKRENFSSLCSQLIMKQFIDAMPIDGRGGDEGIDTIVGVFNGVCQAFQHKYFLEKIGSPQRRQIERSLAAAISHHQLIKWTLIIPKDLTPSEIRWFQTLKQKYAPLQVELWGKARLYELLATYPDVAREYQPKPTLVMIVASKGIDVKRVAADALAETLDEAIGGPALPARPRDILEAAAEDLKRRVTLRVLILGPGPSTDDVYRKRCEIRERLRRLGHEAAFVEEIWTPEVLARSGLNLSVAEFLQANAFDYIVCLMASPGSIAEAHDFARHKKLASKMMICIDRDHECGYSAQSLIRVFEGLNGRTERFQSPIDIRDCHLATRVLDHIQKVAEAKQWALATGGSPP